MVSPGAAPPGNVPRQLPAGRALAFRRPESDTKGMLGRQPRGENSQNKTGKKIGKNNTDDQLQNGNACRFAEGRTAQPTA